MGLSGTQNFFISNFQMNKILFYLQILSLSWLFIKSNISTFSSHGIGNGTGMGLGLIFQNFDGTGMGLGLKIFRILITNT